MAAENGKKAKVTDTAPEEDIDEDFMLTVKKLQEAQDEIDKVDEQKSGELLQLERKYNEIRRPFYRRRNEILKTIPEFWLTVFLGHPVFCDYLSAEDQKIFQYLSSLDMEDVKDATAGFALTFNFNENPYFEDRELTKTVTFFDDGTAKVTGTTIKWKDKMGFANTVDQEKKGSKRLRVEDSFFNWFNQDDQTDADEFEDEVFGIFREEIWPNPLIYFSNETDEEGSEDDEMENGDDDDEENDEAE